MWIPGYWLADYWIPGYWLGGPGPSPPAASSTAPIGAGTCAGVTAIAAARVTLTFSIYRFPGQ